MYGDHYHQHQHQHESPPDPLNDFLAPLLADIPDVLPDPNGLLTSSSQLLAAATSAIEPAADHTTTPQLTCQWVSPQGPPLVCGAPLSPDPKRACAHFRQAHDIRGNEKVTVVCHWRFCHVPPMQRGSLIRHVLTVHLGLLRWQCEMCGRVFSRRGTAHVCAEDG